MEKVVVLGAGSWGTALSMVLAQNGHQVVLWEYQEELAKKLQNERENRRLLPGVIFPENIEVVSESTDLLKDVKYAIFSVPSQVLRSVVQKFSSQIRGDMILVNTAKGIEIATGMRLSEVMRDEMLGKYHKNIVVLSGPTHAEEVSKGLPTTIVAAGEEEKTKQIQELFNNSNFRVYLNDDLIGVEIGAAVKNCLAIAAGALDGLGCGDNTKAALITRGIAEISRYGKCCGAKESTFSGLSGIGDLIVTAMSQHSRNRYVGEHLGRGENIQEILSKMTMVAEGVPTVKAVYQEMKKYQISMPIVEAVYRVIYENMSAKEMMNELMNRSVKKEFY